jgi:hypothetical protein
VIRVGGGALRYRASRIEEFISERERLSALRSGRRTMATHAQSMGSVKDIEAYLRHAKADPARIELGRVEPALGTAARESG